jgi:hypothetical protein
MFGRLKDVISKQDEREQGKRPPLDVSFLNAKEVDDYRRVTLEVTESLDEISELSKNNRQAIREFIEKQREEKEQHVKETEEDEEQFTF